MDAPTEPVLMQMSRQLRGLSDDLAVASRQHQRLRSLLLSVGSDGFTPEAAGLELLLRFPGEGPPLELEMPQDNDTLCALLQEALAHSGQLIVEHWQSAHGVTGMAMAHIMAGTPPPLGANGEQIRQGQEVS